MAFADTFYSVTVSLFRITCLLMVNHPTYVISFHSGHHLNISKLLADFVLVCGSSEGFCNKSQSPFVIEPHFIPYCANDLSCHKSCALASSCAPDAEFAYIDVSCTSSSIYPLKEINFPKRYNMVTRCGVISATVAIDDMCANLPERSIENLHADDFKPVISRSSLITYRNLFCAKCNGENESDLRPFETEVTCTDQFDINSFTNPKDVWKAIYINNCSVSYRPPEGVYDVYECYTDKQIISRCNITGLWNPLEYDSETEWACQHFNSIPYQNFKNIYCYICNPSLVSTHNPDVIASCNVTSEWYFPDNVTERGCKELSASSRISPFKNKFCKMCNGIDDESYYVRRQFLDFNVTIIGEVEIDHLTGGVKTMTTFSNLEFDTTHHKNDTYEEDNPDQPVFDHNRSLTALGTLCGYQQLCTISYTEILSLFWPCNFPCTKNTYCCNSLSKGINPQSLITVNVSVSFDHLETIHHVSNMSPTNDSTFKGRRIQTDIPVIGSCTKRPSLISTVSNNLTRKCEEQSVDDILAYIPVSSVTTSLAYKSIYCARCNGELGKLQALVDFTVDCKTIIDAGVAANFNDINDILKKENCDVKLGKPIDRCIENSRCTRTCPIKSFVEQSDDLAYLCENAYLVISMYPNVQINNTLYKNIFCFLCNVNWHKTDDENTIHRCNQTGEWNYEGDTIIFEHQCATMPFHPALYPFRNIFCAACNSPMGYFENYGGIIETCTGPSCLFKGSMYRFAFSFSPPDAYMKEFDTNKKSSEFCSPGKILVDGSCQSLIENTINLQYQLSFKLVAVDLDLNGNVTVLSMLEAVREQIVQQILLDSHDELQFSSVTITSSYQCKTGIDNVKLITSELINGGGLLFAGFIDVISTNNRTRLERFLISCQSGQNYNISIGNGSFIVRSQPSEISPECQDPKLIKPAEGCVISNTEGITQMPAVSNLLKVNRLLNCVLQKVKSVTREEIEELCLKEIPFKNDTEDEGSLTMCKNDIEQLEFLTEKDSSFMKREEPSSLSVALAIFSFACTCCSLVCLILTFLTYSLFRSLKTIPGVNNMNLVLTLFGAQIFTQFGVWQTGHEGICIILGIITHYFWLCTFCAMNVCSFHMFRVFTSSMYSSHYQSKWIVLKYCVYIYVMPVAVILLYAVIKVSIDGSQRLGYGGSVCFISELIPIISVLIVPAAAIIITNATFSGLAYRHIRSAPHLQSTINRNDFIIYIKLLTVTGIAWPFMFIDAILPLSAFSFIATFANALQGVFIFCAFICNKKVLNLYRKFLCKRNPYSFAGAAHGKSTSETVM